MKTASHLKSLDGLRAVAILLVMLFHAELIGCGWAGVQLFFVLSGFLITGILLREKAKAQSLGRNLRNFWGRRVLRIFPLYFGYLLLLGVIYSVTHLPSSFPKFLPYLLTYSVNYTATLPFWRLSPTASPMWSLCVEEQFYLLFPLFLFLVRPRWIPRVMIAFVLAAPLVRYGLQLHYLAGGHSAYVTGQAVYWNGLSHVDAFFLGGLIPVLSLDRRVRRPGIWVMALLIPTALALAWTGLPCAVIDHGASVWGYSLVDAFFAAVLLSLVNIRNTPGTGWLRGLLSTRMMVNIGKVSYGMYIFHTCVQVYFFDRYFPHPSVLFDWLLFVPYAAVVFGVSWVSYRLYESRFIRLKDVFFPTGPSGVPAANPTAGSGTSSGPDAILSLSESPFPKENPL